MPTQGVDGKETEILAICLICVYTQIYFYIRT